MELTAAEIYQHTTRYKNRPFSPQFRPYPYLSLRIPSKYSTYIPYSPVSFPISRNPPADNILGDPQLPYVRARSAGEFCWFLVSSFGVRFELRDSDFGIFISCILAFNWPIAHYLFYSPSLVAWSRIGDGGGGCRGQILPTPLRLKVSLSLLDVPSPLPISKLVLPLPSPSSCSITDRIYSDPDGI